jgi:hypothetical protein
VPILSRSDPQRDRIVIFPDFLDPLYFIANDQAVKVACEKNITATTKEKPFVVFEYMGLTELPQIVKAAYDAQEFCTDVEPECIVG